MTELTRLRLGADTVTHLLPHRRPFLFVDGVTEFARGPRARLRAFKHVSVNEPVFEGHFPGLALWPGVYTIEGLGQTINALTVLGSIVEGFERHGRAEADALEALRGLERRHRLGAREPSEDERALVAHLGDPRDRFGFSGAVDVKLTEPVFAGVRLDYDVALSRAVGNALRFDVRATVEDRIVAQGTMTSALPTAAWR